MLPHFGICDYTDYLLVRMWSQAQGELPDELQMWYGMTVPYVQYRHVLPSYGDLSVFDNDNLNIPKRQQSIRPASHSE